jgi:hypothetical protein
MVLVAILLSLMQSAMAVSGPLPAPAAPPGLQVELRTASGKNTFRLSEIVPLEVALRSSTPSTYWIELADGWNWAPNADRFLVEPSTTILDRSPYASLITCCDSLRRQLTSKAAVYQHELTDFLRFTEPGEYRIQYTTRRVFGGPANRKFDPSDMLIRSNVLTITVTDDEPQWLDVTLADALRELAGSRASRDSDGLTVMPSQRPRASTATIMATAKLRRAERQLRMLDTPEAIRARVAHLDAFGEGMAHLRSCGKWLQRGGRLGRAIRPARSCCGSPRGARGRSGLWHHAWLLRTVGRSAQ